MSAGDPLCPAVRYDRPQQRVICIWGPYVPGAVNFICFRCLEAIRKRADDREAMRQEWEVEDLEPLP